MEILTSSQTSTPAECRWCGKPATTVRDVVPAEITARTKLIRRPAISADVCDEHAAMIDRNVRRAELERVISRWTSQLASLPHSPRRKRIIAELGRARLELAELNS